MFNSLHQTAVRNGPTIKLNKFNVVLLSLTKRALSLITASGFCPINISTTQLLAFVCVFIQGIVCAKIQLMVRAISLLQLDQFTKLYNMLPVIRRKLSNKSFQDAHLPIFESTRSDCCSSFAPALCTRSRHLVA